MFSDQTELTDICHFITGSRVCTIQSMERPAGRRTTLHYRIFHTEKLFHHV